MTNKFADRRPIVRLALSRTEVALAIGVSVGSVDQMVEEGVLPKPRRWHSRKLWLVSEIEAHLSEWPVDGEDWSPEPRQSVAREYTAPDSAKGPGGYPIVRDPRHPLNEYYQKLGFDPATMGQEDATAQEGGGRAMGGDNSRETPLGKRERAALEQLSAYPPRVPILPSKIKNCGQETALRLQARGYLIVTCRAGDEDLIESYTLTEAGKAASNELASRM